MLVYITVPSVVIVRALARARREKSWTRPGSFSIDHLVVRLRCGLPTIGLTVTKRSPERINLSSTLPRTIDRERTYLSLFHCEIHAYCQKKYVQCFITSNKRFIGNSDLTVLEVKFRFIVRKIHRRIKWKTEGNTHWTNVNEYAHLFVNSYLFSILINEKFFNSHEHLHIYS